MVLRSFKVDTTICPMQCKRFYLGLVLREGLQKRHSLPSMRRGGGVDELRPEIDPHAPAHVQGHRGEIGSCSTPVNTRKGSILVSDLRIKYFDVASKRSLWTNSTKSDIFQKWSVPLFPMRRKKKIRFRLFWPLCSHVWPMNRGNKPTL